MLASPAPTANSGLSAHDLSNEPLDITGTRQKVAMATMIAEDPVSGLERVGNGDSDQLLANAGMHCAKQLSGSEELEQSLLHFSNQDCLTHAWRNGSLRNLIRNRRRMSHQLYRMEVH